MARLAIRILATPVMATACAAACLAASAGRPLPYRVVVVVEAGRLSGPSSFLAELKRELLAALVDEGCFVGVLAERPPTASANDLVVRLVVSGYDEEMEFEYRVGADHSPGFDPRGRSVAHLEARLTAEVRTLDDDLLVRADRYFLRAAWRPFMNEDPRAKARRELVAKAVRKTRAFACKGTPSAWSKQLRRAGASAPR